MRYFLLVVALLFPLHSYANDTVKKEKMVTCKGGRGVPFDDLPQKIMSSTAECANALFEHYKPQVDAYWGGRQAISNPRYAGGNQVFCDGSYDGGAVDNFFLGYVYTIYKCPDSHPNDNGDGTCSRDDKPDKNYCDTIQANVDLEQARITCFDGNPDPANYDTHFEGTCNREAQTIISSCDHVPHNPNPNPDPNPKPKPNPDDNNNGGNNGGDDNNGGNNGGGDDNNGIDPRPDPDGGGSGGDDKDDFCKNNPQYCKPVDKPECRDAPWLCDVPPEPDEDLIAAINRVTSSIRDHNKTSVDVKSNTRHAANNTNKSLDKLEALKRNTFDIHGESKKMVKVIEMLNDQTKKTNDILKLKVADVNDKNAKAILRKADDRNQRLKDIADMLKKGIKVDGNGKPDPTKPGPMPGGLSGALSTMNSELKDMNKELKKSFCDKNKDHLSCKKVSKKDPYKDILSNDDIADLRGKTSELQEDIKTKINDFKGLLGNPTMKGGGSIKPIDFTLYHAGGSVSVNNDAFNQIGSDVSTLVISICGLIALYVVCRR